MENSKTTLVDLFNNKPLVSKIEYMIDDNKTLQEITNYANKMGANVSLGTIRNYKMKREEAIQQDIPLENLLDKRAKTKVGNVLELKEKEVSPLEENVGNEGGVGVYKTSAENIINVNQIMEEIMNKGVASLREVDYVDQNTLLKTMVEYNKINAGNGGLTLAGLQEIKLRQAAYESAISDVLLNFIPEEQHEEVLEFMQKAEDKYYNDLDLTEAGKKARKELKRLGIVD